MIAQQRMTRSKLIQLGSIENHIEEINCQKNVRISLKDAIQNRKWIQALKILNRYPAKEHWVACTKAAIMFKKGQSYVPFNLVKKAIEEEPGRCVECLELFIKMAQKNISKLDRYLKTIKKCMKSDDVPKNIKIRLSQLEQQFAFQITQKYGGKCDKYNDLIENYRNKGVMFSGVEINQITSEYRIARAKQNIKPLQIIIKVPQKEIITLERSKDCPQVLLISNYQLELKSPKHCMLATFIMYEKKKGQQSIYYHYIQTFPLKMQTFPIYYNSEQLRALEGSSFLPALKRKRKDLKEDYNKVINIAPQISKYMNYQSFVWARMIVSSRIFGIGCQQKKMDALVPIADMLNHRSPKMTAWYYSETERAFIVENGHQIIQKGEQIYDSYGSKCNSRFLLNYGFTLVDNPANEVTIVLKKYKNNGISPTIRLPMSLLSDDFQAMLSYYRYYAQNKDAEQSQEQESVTSSTRSKNIFISRQNELKTWEFIKQTIVIRQNLFTTSLQSDQQLLSSTDGNLTFNIRNCVQLRYGQKKILAFYLEMSNSMIEYYQKGIKIKNRELYMDYFNDLKVQKF